MKYVVMLGDGMADRPVAELGYRTPLEAACKPNMDRLAQAGETGLTRTIPDGMPAGSDTANLAVMGYNPREYYTGRSPLEAVSMGVQLAPDDVAFRCNLVTVSDAENYADATMVDYSADEITTAEAAELIAYLNENLPLGEDMKLFAGVSYRHCLRLSHAETGSDCTPPHDILSQRIGDHLPKGKYAERLLTLMERSRELLSKHPVNLARAARGLHPANSCWFWGAGTAPQLRPFEELYGLHGGVISAVDLIKGIGIAAGMEVPDVEGATGTLETNFAGKAAAAIHLLKNGCDLVYIHVEAPDECGHRHEIDRKVKAVERIDSDILGPVIHALESAGEAYSILLMPDHPTPLDVRTHTREPIPFVIDRSDRELTPHTARYTENYAGRTGLTVEEGWRLMGRFTQK